MASCKRRVSKKEHFLSFRGDDTLKFSKSKVPAGERNSLRKINVLIYSESEVYNTYIHSYHPVTVNPITKLYKSSLTLMILYYDILNVDSVVPIRTTCPANLILLYLIVLIKVYQI